MATFDLRVYQRPSQVEALLEIELAKGWELITAIVDTGAEISLFPISLLEIVGHRVLGEVVIEQGGIAQQAFIAVEAEINVQLVSYGGQRSKPTNMTALFADTEAYLLGFGALLDQAVLHIDMPRLTGYLELNT